MTDILFPRVWNGCDPNLTTLSLIITSTDDQTRFRFMKTESENWAKKLASEPLITNKKIFSLYAVVITYHKISTSSIDEELLCAVNDFRMAFEKQFPKFAELLLLISKDYVPQPRVKNFDDFYRLIMLLKKNLMTLQRDCNAALWNCFTYSNDWRNSVTKGGNWSSWNQKRNFKQNTK